MEKGTKSTAHGQNGQGSGSSGGCRVKSAEKAIKGRPIDEKAAVQAAEAAVEASLPLAMNDYKRSITKALVKRAVLGE